MGYCSIPMICFKAQISIITTSAYAAGMRQICLFSGCGITMTSLSVNNGRDETWVRNLGDGVTQLTMFACCVTPDGSQRKQHTEVWDRSSD